MLNAVIGQVIAEGDYVVVHYMITNNRDNGRPITSSGGRGGGPKIGTNVMEIFRLQNGKIAEKWDDLEALDNMSVFQKSGRERRLVIGATRKRRRWPYRFP